MTTTVARGGHLRHVLIAAAALAAAPPSGAALAATGDRQFVIISGHEPQNFLRSLNAGRDFVKSGRGRQFRIVLASGGVILAIPGMTTVQRDYMKTRTPGVQVIACKESIDALSQANKRRIPVLPGVSLQKCQGLHSKMIVSGWQSAPGF